MKKTKLKNKIELPKNLLFEIGTEELPATNLADIFENSAASVDSKKPENALEMRLRKVFEEKRIAFQNHYVWATPRRLVFVIEGVEPKQTSKDILTKVLVKEEAYSSDGKPTEKFLTILKHRNASVSETLIQPLQDKEYVFIKKTEPALATEKVLPDIFKTLVKSLAFPKNMKWGKKWEDGSELYFPRPIKSFLCIYGDKPLTSFSIAGIKVSDQISVFSKSQRRSFKIKTFKSYFDTLAKQNVILAPKERKAKILKDLEAQAKALKGKLYDDPFLLNEVNFLVEDPHVVKAPFDAEFLKLPVEVLAVSMARKQRIFGLTHADGRLMPNFLAVLDGSVASAEEKMISKNIENILHAKLKDSLFFYQEDLKVGLEKKREELKSLIFLKGAGSMLEKSDRLVSLAKNIQVEGLSGEDRRKLELAAGLCKADLLTQMVGEFPELQGVMGRYYADKDSSVAQAIGEQYLPRTVQDKLPTSKIGSVLSILDKVDLIVACFGLGLEPSSSMDPYGLRRSAGAIVKISLQSNIDFSLRTLLQENKSLLLSYVKKDKDAALLKKVQDFFEDRFKAVKLAEWNSQFGLGVIEAICASRPLDSFIKTERWVEALNEITGQKYFWDAHKVIERIGNILKGNKEALPSEINPSLFTEDLEKRVFEQYGRFSQGISEAARSDDFQKATSLYAEAFFAILNEFFEKVFVYCDDLNVRKNRLLLLRTVKELYIKELADLSKIRL